MTTLAARLYQDEAGFIVSAELVLVSTIAVLGLIVGLSEVSLNINNELEDVGSAFSSLQQTYHLDGTCGHRGHMTGSCFKDKSDFCDRQYDIN
jgi:hypothetical protein